MATFPALKPSSRTFTPGVRPHSQIRTMDGGQSRVRQSNVLVDQRLRLSFTALTETQMLSIRTHYIGQQGRFLSFDIPNDLLSGTITPANFTPTGYSWVYASTPIIQDVGRQRYTVSLELVTVPPEGANISGAEFAVTVTLAAGAATSSINNTGFDLTVTASLEAGAVGGDVTSGVPGFNLTVNTSLTAGEAIGIDPDVVTYVAAVESADGQSLESGVVVAVNNFVKGCKADGVWNAIKASCILAGARTLAGALVPLVGTAPTNNNFVSGDYSRTTGLVGDGSTKYLDSNRNNNADPQNSQHMAVFPTTVNTTDIDRVYIGIGLNTTGSTYFATRSVDAFARNRSASADTGLVRGSAGGLIGVSRSTSSDYTYRRSGTSQSVTRTSETPRAGNVFVYQGNGFSAFSNARLSFYSIGESLDLALLDTRVTALMNAITAAIP